MLLPLLLFLLAMLLLLVVIARALTITRPVVVMFASCTIRSTCCAPLAAVCRIIAVAAPILLLPTALPLPPPVGEEGVRVGGGVNVVTVAAAIVAPAPVAVNVVQDAVVVRSVDGPGRHRVVEGRGQGRRVPDDVEAPKVISRSATKPRGISVAAAAAVGSVVGPHGFHPLERRRGRRGKHRPPADYGFASQGLRQAATAAPRTPRRRRQTRAPFATVIVDDPGPLARRRGRHPLRRRGRRLRTCAGAYRGPAIFNAATALADCAADAPAVAFSAVHGQRREWI